MLDLMVPPEAQVSMQSEMAVMGWVLPADLSSDQGEIPLLVFLKEREERGLTWRGVCSWGQFLAVPVHLVVHLSGLWVLHLPRCPSGNATQ